MKTNEYKLFSDGGARGNPGPSASAYLLYENNKIIEFDSKFLGNSTNNIAEYTALLIGLEYVVKKNIKEITCFLDSELVVKQLKGEYKVKHENLKPIFEKISKLICQFSKIEFVHIERSKNFFADKLVNITLDANEQINNLPKNPTLI